MDMSRVLLESSVSMKGRWIVKTTKYFKTKIKTNFSYAPKILTLDKSTLISFSRQLSHLETIWLKYLNTLLFQY